MGTRSQSKMIAKDKDPVVDSDSEDDVPPSLSDDDEAAPPMAMRTLTDEVELWCSAEEFETVWSGCFDRAQRGQGSHGRHISMDVVLATCQSVHQELPSGLRESFPIPDREFVETSLQQVLPQIVRDGIDENDVPTAVQVVLLQMAAAVELMIEHGHEEILRTVANSGRMGATLGVAEAPPNLMTGVAESADSVGEPSDGIQWMA